MPSPLSVLGNVRCPLFGLRVGEDTKEKCMICSCRNQPISSRTSSTCLDTVACSISVPDGSETDLRYTKSKLVQLVTKRKADGGPSLLMLTPVPAFCLQRRAVCC